MTRPDIPERMRAARLHEPGPVVIEEIPTPFPGEGEVLVRVAACGVCGSDVHLTLEKTQVLAEYPRTPGHEAAGIVVDTGLGVDPSKVGERVAIWCGVGCGRCDSCLSGNENLCDRFEVLGYDRDGAFAQYVCVPEKCAIPLDEGIPFEIGAILSDAVSTPYHALAVRGGLRPGETVAVFGCGGLGVHAVLLARTLGASKVYAVDVRSSALASACERGADVPVNAVEEKPSRVIRRDTGGRGVDLAIELVGLENSIEEASKCLARKGRLVLVGIGRVRPRMPLIEPFVAFSQSILGSFGARRQDLKKLIQLTAEGKLDLQSSISDRRPLDDLNDCLNILSERRQAVVRTVILPNGNL